jgi:hypothetical protein
MDFPDKVKYVTFLKEEKDGEIKGLRGNTPYQVDTHSLSNKKEMVHQKIGKDDFKFLKQASQSNDNYAFAQYFFYNETWSREIKMYQSTTVNSQYHSYSDRADYTNDTFQGLVISFNRKPDLDKRKKICEY